MNTNNDQDLTPEQMEWLLLLESIWQHDIDEQQPTQHK